MAAGNFDPQLNILPGGRGVTAKGPLDPGDTVREMCVWVFQRGTGATDDAAAVNMGSGPFPAGRWQLEVNSPGGKATFVPGPAVGYAIALIDAAGADVGAPRTDEARMWSQPVELV